jgi:hypothetical protein
MQKYRPYIEKFIGELPLLTTLSDFKWNLSHRPNISLFGGVLRWIVERVEDGLTVDLKSFLEVGDTNYRPDIDIKVDGRWGSETALRNFFERAAEGAVKGAVIEYVGSEYGGSDPDPAGGSDLGRHPNQKIKSNYIGGNYMVYIPLEGGRYLKYDIAFGKKAARSTTAGIDFTANALTYPHAWYDHNLIFRCIEDIKNRRVVRLRAKENPKSVYRLSKMLDRGYVPIDRISTYRWYLECIKGDPAKGTIGNTSLGPSVGPSVGPVGEIQGSRHVFTEVDADFAKKLPSVIKLFDGLTPTSTLVDPYPTPLPSYKDIGVTKRDVRAYKLVVFEGVRHVKSKVCLELLVPKGTEYLNEYGSLYRFKSVIPVRVFAYPNIPIWVPPGAKLTAPYYKLEYSLYKEAIALRGDKDLPLSHEETHGIYTFDNIEDVWGEVRSGYCQEWIQFGGVEDKSSTRSFIEMFDGDKEFPGGMANTILSNYDLFVTIISDPRFFEGNLPKTVFEVLTCGRLSEYNLRCLDNLLKDARIATLVCKERLFYDTCMLAFPDMTGKDPKAIDLLEILLKNGVVDATGKVCESKYCHCKREDVKGKTIREIIKAFGTEEMVKLADDFLASYEPKFYRVKMVKSAQAYLTISKVLGKEPKGEEADAYIVLCSMKDIRLLLDAFKDDKVGVEPYDLFVEAI